MEKKNQKLLIVVGVLLLFGGISLAYFVSNILLNGNGANTKITTTANINGATLKVEGTLSFEVMEMYPGHKDVSAIKVTAAGNNELIPYNLIWKGTNMLTTPLNYNIYKTSEQLSVTSTCNKKTQIISGAQALSEECSISNIDKLGTEISSGTINKNDTKVTLAKDEFMTATVTGDIKYYYVILEYPNLDEPQNYDLEGTLEGEVTVEESNTKPDINILAAYVVQEDGTYKEVDDIPQSGYLLNNEKSTCNNGAIPSWDTKNHRFYADNLTTSGTSCYLYFDKVKTSSEKILATGELINENGYRYEGSNPNNYVRFNNELWRIIGVFETTKSDNTKEQLVKIIRDESIGNIAWDTLGTNGSNDWSESDLKTILNGQYLNGENINYTYRNPSNSYISNSTVTINNVSLNEEAIGMIEEVIWSIGGASSGSITTEAMYAAERGSIGADNSTTNISWTGKVGLMYASDYGYASPSSTCNRTTTFNVYDTSGCYDNNWLFKNSYNQWTLTPYSSRSNGVFSMRSNGNVSNSGVPLGYGARPSVYLKFSIKITDGDGSQNHPYIIES